MMHLTEPNGAAVYISPAAVVCIREPDEKARERKAGCVIVAQLLGRVLVSQSPEEVMKIWQSMEVK